MRDPEKHDSPPAAAPAMDITAIQRLLPHRYPMLLIDRVLEVHRRKRIVALKNVTVNEPFFNGHFPGFPLMPGVLMVEAIAQAGAVLLLSEVEGHEAKLMVFASIEKAKFRRPVRPGDQLRIEVDVIVFRSNAAKLQGKVFVDGKLVCEAIVSCQLASRSPQDAAL